MTRQERDAKKRLVDRCAEAESALQVSRNMVRQVAEQREGERRRGDDLLKVLNEVIGTTRVLVAGAEGLRYEAEQDAYERMVKSEHVRAERPEANKV